MPAGPHTHSWAQAPGLTSVPSPDGRTQSGEGTKKAGTFPLRFAAGTFAQAPCASPQVGQLTRGRLARSLVEIRGARRKLYTMEPLQKLKGRLAERILSANPR